MLLRAAYEYYNTKGHACADMPKWQRMRAMLLTAGLAPLDSISFKMAPVLCYGFLSEASRQWKAVSLPPDPSVRDPTRGN